MEQKLFRKGQQTIIGLILLGVMVITLSAFTPTINSFVGTAAGNMTSGGYGEASLVVRLIPLFMWLGLIITIFIFTQPSYQ